MPHGVVETKQDEKDWEIAKAAAKKEGKGKNYAYITAIYMRIKKGRKKGGK